MMSVGRRASRPVLGGGDADAADLAVAAGVDADRDHGVDIDDAAALADLLGQRVHPDERIWPGVERPAGHTIAKDQPISPLLTQHGVRAASAITAASRASVLASPG